MILKLNGKSYKQITKEEYRNLEGDPTAIFIDTYNEENTYFKEINKK